MKRYFLLLLSSLLLSASLYSQITWQQQKGPYGGTVKDIIYMQGAAKVFALMKTNNSQTNGYYAGLGTVYVSADNGATWTRLELGTAGSPNASSDFVSDIETDGTNLYIIAAAQSYQPSVSDLYVSTDNGVTFALKNPSSKFQGGVMLRASSSALYVYGTTAAGSNTYTLWKSTNAGVAWNTVAAYPTNSGYVFQGFVIDSNGTGNIFVATNDATKIVESQDGGVTFNTASSGIPATRTINSIVTNTAKGIVYCVGVGGSATDDIYQYNGTTWSTLTTGITDTNFGTGSNSPETSFLFFTPDDSKMYFVNNNGAFRDLWSRTSGVWALTTSTFVSASEYGATGVVLVDATHWFISTDGFGVYKTNDALTTLNPINNGINGIRFNSLAQANVTNTIFAGGDQLYSTPDYGNSWTNVSAGFGSYRGTQTVVKANGGVLLTFGGYQKRSNNNGTSWIDFVGGGTAPNNVQGLATYDGTRIIVYTNNGNSISFFLYNLAQDKWYGPMAPTGLPASYQFSSLTVDEQWNLYALVRDNSNNNNNTNTAVYKMVMDNTSTPTSVGAVAPSPISYATLGIANGVNDMRFFNNGTPGVYVIGYGASGGTALAKSSDHGTTWNTSIISATQPTYGSRKFFFDEGTTYSFISGFSGPVIDSRDGEGTFNSVGTLSYFGPGSVEDIKIDPAGSPIGVAYALVDFAGLYKTTTTVIPPTAPSLATAVGIGFNQLTLRFQRNSTNEDSIRIERFNGSVYTTVGHLSKGTIASQKMYYTDINLQPGINYQYRISAINVAGNSAFASVSATTLAQTALSIPDNRSWTAVTSNANGLHAPVTTNNVIIRYMGANNSYYVSSIVGGAYATHDSKNDGYFYEVGEVAGNGQTYVIPNSVDIRPDLEGVWNSVAKTITLQWRTDAAVNSNPDKFEIITYTLNGTDPIPATPTNPKALVYNNTALQVLWNSTAYETDYKVEVSLNGTTGWTLVGNVNYPQTNIIDNATAFTAGTTYYYRVTAHNAAGSSAPSANASVVFNKPNFILAPGSVVNSTNMIGAGVIWGDFDNDNDQDLIITSIAALTGVTNIPQGFRNNYPAPDFTPVPLNLDLALNLLGTAADYDNDGKLDLFLTAGGAVNYLYKGNGDFTFTKITTSGADLTAPLQLNGFKTAGIASAWVDYNNDGMLDLFVGTQSDTNNGDNFQNANYLLKQGPLGTFTKVATGTLVTFIQTNSGVSWSDYDNDGDMDIFICDNTNNAPNQLFRNDGNDVFTSVFSTAINTKGFGGSWGDYNNDQILDLYVGAQNSLNYLYKNTSTPGTTTMTSQPASVTTATKPANVFASFSSAWGDIDNDGDLDLVVSSYGANQLFLNNAGVFTSVTSEKFNDERNASIGIALADYNRDGFLDIATSVADPSLFGGGSSAPVIPPSQKLFQNNNKASGNTNHWLQLKLKGTSSNKVGVGARVILTTASGVQTREVSTQTGFASESSLLVHFGLGSNATITSLQIKWPKSPGFPSGIVQNMLPADVPVDHFMNIDEDGKAPDTTLLNPINKFKHVPITTPVEITFSDSLTRIGGKNVTVSVHGGSVVYSTAVTNGTLSANHKTISFTPTPVLTNVTNYDVVVDAGAFTDKYGNATPIISWTFTTKNSQPPVISFTPPARMDNGATTALNVSVTDLGTVSSASLHYRKIAGGAFSLLPATPDGSVTNQWNFAVASSLPDGVGLEYWFTAVDLDGNTGRFPSNATADSTLFTYLNYPLDKSVIPSSVLGLGGQEANWKVFTIPFDLGVNSGVTSVFDEISALNSPNDWRMLTYKTATAWGEYPADFSTFARGTGYFINFRTAPVPLKIGDIVAPSNNRKDLFQLSLKQGWNQIGNPYPVPISWDDVASFNSLTGTVATLKVFSSGNYSAHAALQPFEGGFVFADNATTVSIPFSGQIVIGGRRGQIVSSDLEKDQWQVKIQLNQDGLRNELSGIGMRSTASTGKDDFDDVNPPRFIEYLEMNFPHPEFFAKNLSVDVVPTQSNYVWNFTVDSNLEGVAELLWNNAEFGNNSKGLYLLDVDKQTPIDMRSIGKYTFNPKESSRFRIYFGENLDKTLKPDLITLGNAYPNPSNGATTIPFTLPEKSGPFSVKLEVYDAIGNRITTLVDGSLNSGFYKSEWNSSLANLSDGLYIVRLIVDNQDKGIVRSGKVIIKK